MLLVDGVSMSGGPSLKWVVQHTYLPIIRAGLDMESSLLTRYQDRGDRLRGHRRHLCNYLRVKQVAYSSRGSFRNDVAPSERCGI